MNRRTLLSLAALFASALHPAWPQARLVANAPEQVNKPYVLLISLDGFRFDYAEKYHAANLLAFAAAGVRAKALIPSYPSSTFPNHLSIATGMYPAHHGIVENSFYDPDRNETYHFNETASATDGTWYQAKPIWVIAEQQGMRTATYFWPSSDSEIDHVRPTFWVPYSSTVPDERRTNQVMEWLQLPKERRPHLITLYFSEADHEAHMTGPESPEVEQAVHKLDAVLGALLTRLKSLDFPVNVIIVSDHGMERPQTNIDLSQFADFHNVHNISSGTQVMVYSSDQAAITTLKNSLKGKDARFSVYRREEIPEHLHYRGSRRIGDLVVMANGPYLLSVRPPDPSRPARQGMHGYDPELVPNMRASFFAAGPDIKKHVVIEPFDNVHIFPFIAGILGLNITGPIDGSAAVLQQIRGH